MAMGGRPEFGHALRRVMSIWQAHDEQLTKGYKHAINRQTHDEQSNKFFMAIQSFSLK